MKNLELYVHIPFCMKKCAYCDFLSFSCDERTQLAYADALMREIAAYGSKMKEYQVSTIFVGGGTPTWLNEDKMVEILDMLRAHFQITPDAEVTMECNPGTVTAEKLAKYRKAGVNRLSIGLQSGDDEELAVLGRIHNYEKFLKTYQMAKNAGFSNINVDLISGIPHQTAEKFLQSLQKIVRLKPDHISVYSLIIEEGTPFYEKYHCDAARQQAGMETEILPTEDEVYRITKLTQQFLAQAGYEQYEISNFAQQGSACRHNIGYWTRENYLGLGLGAASLIENVRYANTSDLDSYIKNSINMQFLFSRENVQGQNSRSVDLQREDSQKEDSQKQDSQKQDSQKQDFQGRALQEQDFRGRTNDLRDYPAMETNLHISAEVLSKKAQMEEFMFLGLRMKNGVRREDFRKYFGVPIEVIYKAPLDHLKEQGLLAMNAGYIRLTEQGQDVSNYALAQFLL